jgi:hypothetical protein
MGEASGEWRWMNVLYECDDSDETEKYKIVERPDPKGLSSFSQCTDSLPHRGFELMSSRSGVRRSN